MHIINDHVFINFSIHLDAGHGQGGDNSILPAGSYSYPFQFKLPTNLPSSFEGVIGYVRYTMTAVIDKPWKFDHTTKAPFTVLSILDLNLEPNASVRICIPYTS